MRGVAIDAISQYGKSPAGKQPHINATAPCRFIACAAGRVLQLGVLLAAMALAAPASADAEPEDGVTPAAAAPLQMAQRGEAPN